MTFAAPPVRVPHRRSSSCGRRGRRAPSPAAAAAGSRCNTRAGEPRRRTAYVGARSPGVPGNRATPGGPRRRRRDPASCRIRRTTSWVKIRNIGNDNLVWAVVKKWAAVSPAETAWEALINERLFVGLAESQCYAKTHHECVVVGGWMDGYDEYLRHRQYPLINTKKCCSKEKCQQVLAGD